MMRYILVLVATLMTWASASGQGREAVVVGFGAQSCWTMITKQRESPKAFQYLILSYAQGFWTGQNSMFMQAGVPARNLAGNDETQLKIIMAECERRPSEDFGLIIRDLFFKLPSIRSGKN